MSPPDVIVAGGGAVGVACAYELARAGARVTLLEREATVGTACSAGNAGLVGDGIALPLGTPQALREGLAALFRPDAPFRLRPRPSILPWLLRFALACRPAVAARNAAALAPMGAESFRMHLEYRDSGIDTGIEHRGALLTWESEAGFQAGLEELREAGAHAKVVDPRAQVPSLSASLAGGVIVEDVAHCDSGRWTRGVAAAARELGVDICTGVDVSRLRVEGGRVTGVDTGDGPLGAATTVVAAGVWSDRLLAGAGLRTGLQAGKGYHVDLEPSAGDPRLPVYMQEAHVVATPLAGRLRLAGTLDLSGLDTRVETRRTDAVIAGAARTLPGVDRRRRLELWTGLRPCAPDGMPVVGRTRRAAGLLVATGHAMIGLALAPVTGRLVAELAAGREPEFDVAMLSPDRF